MWKEQCFHYWKILTPFFRPYTNFVSTSVEIYWLSLGVTLENLALLFYSYTTGNL